MIGDNITNHIEKRYSTMHQEENMVREILWFGAFSFSRNLPPLVQINGMMNNVIFLIHVHLLKYREIGCFNAIMTRNTFRVKV